MRDRIRKCRKCGKQIDVITERIYRKIIVDVDMVLVTPDPHGDEYIRLDRTKMRGVPAPMDLEHSMVPAEGVFRIHHCGDGYDEV